jgi:hypothetical protein
MSDLEQIVDGVEPEQNEPEVVEAADPDQEASEATEVAEEPKPEPKSEATVPLAALLEVRQELQALKNLATPKPEPTPAPNVLEDQEGFQKYVGQQLNQQVTNVKLDISEEMTRAAHGDEKVDAAFAAFQAAQDPTLHQSVMQSRNPWGEVVKWHERQTVAAEIGDDPEAYKAKLETEIRQKLEAEMVAKQARDTAGKFAPSMANVTGTGGGPKSNWTGPTDLTSIVGE